MIAVDFSKEMFRLFGQPDRGDCDHPVFAHSMDSSIYFPDDPHRRRWNRP
jgi:hypothetical protein